MRSDATTTTLSHIPLSVPQIGGKEWVYVKECLDTGWVSSVGSFVDRFEETCAELVGARYGVATSSGTAALHIALLLAGVKPDDEVLVSALTFIAPANAVRYVGAWPVFIDAEPRYWQMDAGRLHFFLENECRRVDGELRNMQTGRRVSAILPVHILGHPCDMDAIAELAHRYELQVVEDATESLGARYKGRRLAGDGRLACLSFNGNKLVTTGGGGMILTDDEQLARHAKYLTTQAKDDPVEFVHGEIGFNYRLTNVQAAIGCAQLERLEEYLLIKRVIATRYRQALAALAGITVPSEAPWARSAWWLFTVVIDPERFGCDSRTLMTRLRADHIETRPLWQPLHLSRPHVRAGQPPCPVAEDLHRRALSIPCSVGLAESDQMRVVAGIRAARAV